MAMLFLVFFFRINGKNELTSRSGKLKDCKPSLVAQSHLQPAAAYDRGETENETWPLIK